MELSEFMDESIRKEEERCKALGIEMPTAIPLIHELSNVTWGTQTCPKCGVTTCAFNPAPCQGCGYVMKGDEAENSTRMVGTINKRIGVTGIDTNQISDGYHTFGELYEHRIELFITLCRKLIDGYDELVSEAAQEGCGYPAAWKPKVWRAKLHNDGTAFDGWFILGIGKEVGEQITYHLPLSKWDECWFAETLETAPPFDGHTPADVLERLQQL